MKALVLYVSYGGNTQLIAEHAFREIRKSMDVDLYPVNEFNTINLDKYDGLVLCTLTWGKGQMPSEWNPFVNDLDKCERKLPVVFIGSGDDVYGDNYHRGLNVLINKVSEYHDACGRLKLLLKPKTDDDYARINKICNHLVKKIKETSI